MLYHPPVLIKLFISIASFMAKIHTFLMLLDLCPTLILMFSLQKMVDSAAKLINFWMENAAFHLFLKKLLILLLDSGDLLLRFTFFSQYDVLFAKFINNLLAYLVDWHFASSTIIIILRQMISTLLCFESVIKRTILRIHLGWRVGIEIFLTTLSRIIKVLHSRYLLICFIVLL